MSVKQTEVFNDLSATFSPEIIKKWEEMIMKWEVNPQAPNPYAEPESGEYCFSTIICYLLICIIGTTLQDVRLALAREEAAQVALGKLPRHKISLSAFLFSGFELEDSQYVRSTYLV